MIFEPRLQGKTRSEQELREAEAVARKQESVPSLIAVLRELASLYQRDHEPEKALELSREAADLALRHRHPEVREIFLQLIALQAALDRNDDAEAAADELISLGPGALVPDHLAYCQAYLVKAFLVFSRGALSQTENYFRTGVSTATRLLGEKHELTIHTRQELANFLSTAERFDEALKEQRLVCELDHAVYGPSDLRFAEALNSLGVIYDQLGNHLVAKDLYQRVLDFSRKAVGEGHPLVAKSMYNLAEVARVMRDHEAASRGFKETMEIEERLRGRESVLFGFALKNFGLLQEEQGRYCESEPLLLEAVEIAKKNERAGAHLSAAAALALGILYEHREQPQVASQWLDQALTIYTKQSGPNSPSCARVLLTTARCKAQHGEKDAALELARTAVDMMALTLGEQHWETSGARHQLAMHLATKGEWERALSMMGSAAEADDQVIVQVLRSRPRRQAADLIQASRRRLLEYLGVLNAFQARAPAHVRRAYDYVLRRKGLESAGARLQRDSGLLLLTGVEMELRRLRRRLLRLRLRSAAAQMSGESVLAIERIRGKIEELESQLAQSVPEGRIFFHLFEKDAEVVSRGLPEGAALVEFVDGVPSPSGLCADDDRGERHLLAFVLRADATGQVTMLDIGNSADIAKAIDRFRASLEEGSPQPGTSEPHWIATGESVRKLLFEPLRDSIGNAQQILIAPDGVVESIVFETLPTDGNTFLLDRFCISYLQSGREVSWKSPFGQGPATTASSSSVDTEFVGFDLAGGASLAPAVVADPDFDASLGPGGIFLNVPEASSALPRLDLLFERLRDTAAEGWGVAKRLQVDPVMEAKATKAVFWNLRSPEILHVCTHGFLVPRGPDYMADDGTPRATPFYQMLSSFDDPLLRCGLALSGANASVGGSASERAAGEGLLWATEVLELDLRSTDMVVLSACHTGLGESRLGDGAVSLRRAFKIAGARSVISSMWEVPDDVTQELMANLYDGLLKEQPRAQALWKAKLTLRHKYPNDPFLWGAFVLEGKPLALDRFKPIKHAQLRFPKVFNELIAEETEYVVSEAARYLARARKAQNKGNMSKALSLLRRVRQAKSVKQKLIDKTDYEIACIYRRTGEFERARDCYTKLLERHDLGAQLWLDAHFDRGTTHAALSDFRSAIEDYTHVLLSEDTIPPEMAFALVNRGMAFWNLDEIDAALEDFSSVVILADAPPDQQGMARINRGQIFASFGDYGNAIADYTAVLTLSGVKEVLQCKSHLHRATALIKQGRREEARPDLTAVFERVLPGQDASALTRELLDQIESASSNQVSEGRDHV